MMKRNENWKETLKEKNQKILIRNYSIPSQKNIV